MEKIFLVICTGYLGDVIITSKLIKDIHKNYPSSKILYICDEPYSSVAKNLPFVDEVFHYARKNELNLFTFAKFYLSFPYKNKITHTFIIHENKSSRKLLAKILGSKTITAWEDFRYSEFNKNLIEKDKKYENIAYLNANLLSVITDKPTDDENIEFLINEDISYKIKEKIKEVTQKEIITLNPNCLDKQKAWDTNEFLNLTAYVIKNGFMPVITGLTKDGTEFIDVLIQNKFSENVDYINMLDKTDFEELGAFCKLSKLVITVDTGTAHFASAV